MNERKTKTLLTIVASASPTDTILVLGGNDCENTADTPANLKRLQALVTKYADTTNTKEHFGDNSKV